MAKQLTVTAPLVVVTDEESGLRHYVYEGAPVPSFVTGDQKKRLTDDGLIEEIDVENTGVDYGEKPSKSTASKK